MSPGRVLVAGLFAALALGCEPDPTGEIEAEIAALEEKRVAIVEVEKARADADAEEREVAQAVEKVAAAEARERSEAAKRDARTLEVTEAEVALAEAIAAIAPLRAQTEEAKQKTIEVERRIVATRAAGRRLRDRAATLEGQIRPADPEWATARRLQVLEDLVKEVASARPGDAALASLLRASSAVVVGADPRAAAEAGRERAARLRRRIGELYRLDDPSLSALDAPPAPPKAP